MSPVFPLETFQILKEKIFTVSEFLNFLNEILTPQLVVVQGEIGMKPNIRPNYASFNLLDKKEKALLKCFAWNDVLKQAEVPLKEGLEVRVFGFPQIKKEWGEFRFLVKKIEFVGLGELKKQFELRKKKLSLLGYFDLEKKKKIPEFCKKIGLISSKYGRGALKDFLTHLGNFGFEIYFYDTRVEGPSALWGIISAIEWFNQNMLDLDVLVIIRGGGDWESLHNVFNSEEIVKAIFASKIPVITGIGHEDDVTLADLVADLRASTPTHAAKILTESWKISLTKIKELEKSLTLFLKVFLSTTKERLKSLEKEIDFLAEKELTITKERIFSILKNLNFKFQIFFQDFYLKKESFFSNYLKIEGKIKSKKEKIDHFSEKFKFAKESWLKFIKKKLREIERSLKISDPKLKLKQGYSITFDKKGKVLKEISDSLLSEQIKTRLFKGQIISIVKKVERYGKRKI